MSERAELIATKVDRRNTVKERGGYLAPPTPSSAEGPSCLCVGVGDGPGVDKVLCYSTSERKEADQTLVAHATANHCHGLPNTL